MNYEPDIIAAANRHGIAPAIALAVARAESGIQQYWQSGPRKGQLKVSDKGAVGIMQVEPATAPGVDLTDPQKNIEAGVGYLASLLRQFRDQGLAVAAYNWGPRHVQDALAGARIAPQSVINYVDAVLGPGQLGLTAGNKLANVLGPQAAHQVQQTAQKMAHEHPGLLAVGVFGIALVVVLRLR